MSRSCAAVADVRHDGAVGQRMKNNKDVNTSGRDLWPRDIYTGSWMAPGTAPGQFTYVLKGKGFLLTVYLHDGKPDVRKP